jgi:hypothetical protein
MKRIIAMALAFTMLLTACSATADSNVADMDRTVVTEQEDVIADESEIESEEASILENDDNFDVSIKGLEDENLLQYVEDNMYTELIGALDSEEYYVENIEAVYYPKEYIEALASNSQENLYFGCTAAELDAQFHGTKYVFTLGADGQTCVIPMETLIDDVYIKALEDVIVGTGAILICVTVSVTSAPAAPAISMIFAASATTGTRVALESGAMGFVAAAIVKGYETENFEQAMKAGVEASGEGFKWGAITGIIMGGIGETIALKGTTMNGLTINEAAKIQKESGYPLEVIKQLKSYEEYEIYKESGLYTKMVDGKLALVRNIDLDYISELPNGEKVTNLVRMERGYAPLDPVTGKVYQLHHINQDSNGTLAILTEAEHQGNSSILNIFGKESEIDRKAFEKIRQEFWKKYAAGFL